jgi:hypothetical protein
MPRAPRCDDTYLALKDRKELAVRFSVVTVGSEGDTRPLAALCRGLLDHGHEVKLFADHSTLTLARTLGVPCEALQGDMKSIVPIADPRQKLRFSEIMRVGKDLKAFIAHNSVSWLRAVGEHAGRSDAVLFSSLACRTTSSLRGMSRMNGYFHELASQFIMAVPAPRTPRRGRGCLRLFSRSGRTSSSGLDVWPREVLRLRPHVGRV